MLHADKEALTARTKVNLLAVRESELTLYTNNCRTLGTVAAIMSGLAFFGLLYTDQPYFLKADAWVQFVYANGLQQQGPAESASLSSTQKAKPKGKPGSSSSTELL